MSSPGSVLTASNATTPVHPAERVALVDALRGLALLGILLVNMAFFASPMEMGGFDRPDAAGGADLVAGTLVRLFAEGKFYSILSLLFGLGLFIQMSRAQSAGVPFARRWLRRMAILLGFGIAHALLLWDGDILVYYALFGTLLLAFRGRSDRSLVRWACVLVLVPALLLAAGAGLLAAVDDQPAVRDGFQETLTQLRREQAENRRVFGGDDWPAMVRHRAKDYPETVAALAAAMGPSVLAMFLVGMLLGRRGVLHAPADHGPTLVRLVVLGGLVGLPLALVQTWAGLRAGATPGLLVEDFAPVLLSLAAMLVAGPVVAVGYVAGAALVWRHPRGRRVLQLFAPAGRMALTNYLLQSLLATLVFHGHGFGLYDKLGPALWAAIALAIYAAQVLVSRWWLSRHAFGPMEWLWRTLTYGRAATAAGPSYTAAISPRM
jgi:uncharacterized protein